MFVSTSNGIKFLQLNIKNQRLLTEKIVVNGNNCQVSKIHKFILTFDWITLW